jgi:uncharacterized membrane protein
MAQGTGQARRRKAGTEKPSGKKSEGQGRASTGSRAGASANGRGSSSSRPTSKGRSTSKGAASSNGRTATAAKRGSSRSKSPASSKSPARGKGTTRAKSPARRKSTAGGKGIASQARGALKRLGAVKLGSPKKLGAKLSAPKKLSPSRQLDAAKQLKVVKAGRVVMRIPKVAEYTQAAALRVGTAGAALTAARVATHAVKRRRQESQDSRLTRLRKSLPQVPTIPTVPRLRRHRRQVPTPKVSLPKVSLPKLSLPELPHPAELVPDHPQALWLAAVPAGVGAATVVGRARHLPIQVSVDIAVPLQLAYDEWMRLEFLPEGSHTVERIERDGSDALTGRLSTRPWSRKWEAEIRDERDCESFAWRSVKGSDCAGLVTFHDLGERLTRLELQLDIVPVRPLEAAQFALRLADARARNELRRFKARLETISPDAYGESTPTNDKES